MITFVFERRLSVAAVVLSKSYDNQVFKLLTLLRNSLIFVISIIPFRRCLSFPSRCLANLGMSLYAVLILLWLLSRIVSPESVGGEFLIRDRFLFAPGDDRSYFEAFQYMLLGWNSLLIFWLSKKNPDRFNPLFLVWAFLFLDDFIRLHDGFGAQLLHPVASSIYENFNFLGAFIRLKDVSELIWWMLLAFVILVLILLLRRHIGSWDKNLLSANLRFFASLAFFGIFVDVVHANVDIGFLGNGLLTFIEESGEFLTIMAAFVYHFNVLITSKNSQISPSEVL